jgi:hypothetical protein
LCPAAGPAAIQLLLQQQMELRAGYCPVRQTRLLYEGLLLCACCCASLLHQVLLLLQLSLEMSAAWLLLQQQ